MACLLAPQVKPYLVEGLDTMNAVVAQVVQKWAAAQDQSGQPQLQMTQAGPGRGGRGGGENKQIRDSYIYNKRR